MSFKYLNKDQDIFDGDDGEDVYANEEQLQPNPQMILVRYVQSLPRLVVA
jgi:hypothetical protein